MRRNRKILNHALWDKKDYHSGGVSLITSDIEHSTNYIFDRRITHCSFIPSTKRTHIRIACFPEDTALKLGIRCKACDASLSTTNDPELCSTCLEAAGLFRKSLKDE